MCARCTARTQPCEHARRVVGRAVHRVACTDGSAPCTHAALRAVPRTRRPHRASAAPPSLGARYAQRQRAGLTTSPAVEFPRSAFPQRFPFCLHVPCFQKVKEAKVKEAKDQHLCQHADFYGMFKTLLLLSACVLKEGQGGAREPEFNIPSP